MANPMNVFGLVLCALLLLAICSFGFSSRNEFTHQNLRVQETYCPTVSIPRFTHVDFPIHISSKPPKKEKCEAPSQPKFHSQIGQDEYLWTTFFNNPVKCGGIFLDVGAYDGKNISNSLFFEESLGWTSYCVEANPDTYEKLVVNRPRCNNINVAISNRTDQVLFGKGGFLGTLIEGGDVARLLRVDFKGDKEKMEKNFVYVQALTGADLVTIFGLKEIDILSVDIEGAEMGFVTTFPWNEVIVKTITIEANLGKKNEAKNKAVKEVLESKGFIRYRVHKWDEFYINKNFDFGPLPTQ